MSRWILALSAAILVGCSTEAETETSGGGGGADGTEGCAPGEILVPDQGCVAAGVPADACGEGFESDGASGCRAILPSAPCRPGELAIMGETTCHPVAPCARGKWGDIVIDTDTVFVDESYVVGDGDGSELKPWPTIGQGIAAAEPGATIAIAAGSYEEIIILTQPVVLWGRCPADVEIVGGATSIATVDLRPGAQGSIVRSIAVTGATAGIGATGAIDLTVENVWAHDLADAGVILEDALGPTAMTVRDSLIERAGETGILASGASIVVERSVVRDTVGTTARGINVGSSLYIVAPGSAEIRRSLVERSAQIGLYVGGATTTVEETLVHEGSSPVAMGGIGVVIEHDWTNNLPASMTASSVVLQANQLAGVFVNGGTLLMSDSTVRGTRPASDGRFGRGLFAQIEVNTATPGRIELNHSLIDDNHEVGLVVSGAQGKLVATRVRGTKLQVVDMSFGDGVAAVGHLLPTAVELIASHVESSARSGASVFGATLLLDSSALTCNVIDLDGERWGEIDYAFEARGDNSCGCTSSITCKALSSGLAPPGPLAP